MLVFLCSVPMILDMQTSAEKSRMRGVRGKAKCLNSLQPGFDPEGVL